MLKDKEVAVGRKKRRKINSLNKEAPLTVRFHIAERLRETALLFTWALALFIIIALTTYHNSDPSWSHVVDSGRIANAAGKTGAWLSDILLYGFGYAAYLFPILLAYGAWIYYRVRHRDDEKIKPVWPLFSLRFFGFTLVISSFSALMSEHFAAPFTQLPYSTGGVLGSSFGNLLLQLFSMTGATLLAITLFLVGFTLFSGMSWLKAAEKIGALVASKLPNIWQLILQKAKSYLVLRHREQPEMDEFIERRAPKISRQVIDEAEPTFTQQALNLVKPNIVRPTKMVEEEVEVPHQAPRFTGSEVLPEISLLDPAPEENTHTVYDDEQLAQKSNDVEMRLKDFGIQAKVVAVHPGPVVTRFELQLAAGTKVSKISSLVKDLARSLSVLSVRVVEVIPGKSYIGLELPNEKRQVVSLREVLATKTYQNARSSLSLALGKDIAGHPVIVDLAKMPHLLVAGTTGSGKSVGLNAMLLSLLYKSSPTKLRMILIDPKMLEMAVYDGIPHLLSPVVTDMKDAASALRWCVVEMERRYRLMASLGVRNLMGYNEKVLAAKERGTPLYDPLQPVDAKIELEELPRIVVLADEFADMMVVVGKKVETLIARLAQKARAAGIHLIFATQRPSVDVITGLIKANIPTRIAFQVSSKIDSRTILDQQGAEQLLGNGDMLYLPPGSGVPVRVHGAYVSDDEVHRVVSYLKEHGQPEYIENLLDDSAGTDTSGFVQAAMGGAEIEGEQDPLYDEAVEVVVQSQRVSISSIQRRFKIGYNRAACIVEAMEAAGVVSKMEQSGLREVLVPRAQES